MQKLRGGAVCREQPTRGERRGRSDSGSLVHRALWVAAHAAVLGVLVGWANSARADQVVIGPDRDTSLYEESGTLANGAGAHLFAGQNDADFVRRALLHFDVANALPAGSTITGATLTLFCDRTKTQDQALALHRVSADWGEGTSSASGEEGQGIQATFGSATWTRAFFDTASWGVAGGNFVATASATTTVRNANQTYAWSSAAMAADVQAWLDTPGQNYGWILRGNEASLKATKRFSSRENPTLAQHPYLTISFNPPAGTTGACCSALGACTVVTPPGAANCGGSYQGDGTSCTPNPCPQPTGACCLPTPMATCVSVTSADCVMQGGSFQGALAACSPNPCPVVLAPYVDPLPVPAVAMPTSGLPGDAASYTLAIRETWQQLHRDLPMTRVWGYDDGRGTTYPGPTIEARSERPITVTWWNDLRGTDGMLRTDHHLPVDLCPHGAVDLAQTVTHLHGGHVPPSADGYPEATFLPGESDTYGYPNHQGAASLWYHDHALGLTRLNVYMGLAGLYVVRDDVDDALGLPSGAYEVPLVIQDRSFRPDGSLAYPEMFMEHFYGDVVLVNGKVWPYLDVARGKYRFRVLNGSNSRSYHLQFSNGMTFHVIGGDGGLLEAPIAVSELTLTPGERAEIVVDFAPYAATTEIELVNDAAAPFPGVPGENSIREVMLFRVGMAPGHVGALPTSLRPTTALDPVDARVERTFELDKMPDPCTGSMWTINGMHWNDITERPVLGTSEIWSFVNRSGMSHPMHMHLVFFQVLDRHAFVDVGGVATPTGSALAIAPHERGWKDTVQVPPGEIVRVIARFEDYVGRYAYHCHILEHEDHEMMRQFETVTVCGDAILSAPIEACDDGDLVSGDGCESNCLRTCDVVGACDDTDACTTDSCDPTTGCAHAAVVCDDGEDCTVDACAPAIGCAFTPVADGTPCSVGSCVGGVCTAPPVDAGVDAGQADAGQADAGQADAGSQDAGSEDAGADAGQADATVADGGFDAGLDAGTIDASMLDGGVDAGGTRPSSDAGCSCRVAAAPRGASPAAVLVGLYILALAARRGRRGMRATHAPSARGLREP